MDRPGEASGPGRATAAGGAVGSVREGAGPVGDNPREGLRSSAGKSPSTDLLVLMWPPADGCKANGGREWGVRGGEIRGRFPYYGPGVRERPPEPVGARDGRPRRGLRQAASARGRARVERRAPTMGRGPAGVPPEFVGVQGLAKSWNFRPAL